MASSHHPRGPAGGGITVETTTSPKSANGQNSSSPKGQQQQQQQQQQCLCSPTTHQGSFRCRFHRSNSTAYFKRSKSMPVHHNSPSLSPKSVEST